MRSPAILLLFLLAAAAAAFAQKNLAIASLFGGRYKSNPNATETTIKGNSLEDYDLDLYRSLSIVGSDEAAAEIEALLAEDAPIAIDSEVSYKGGRLYYAFYRLPFKDRNRYILYLNDRAKGGDKTVLIYLEGDASMAEIKRMFKHK